MIIIMKLKIGYRYGFPVGDLSYMIIETMMCSHDGINLSPSSIHLHAYIY